MSGPAARSDDQREDRLEEARVLVELGWLEEADHLVADVLDASPDDLPALNLFAKIKHTRGELSLAIACWAQIHARSPHNETALMHLSSLLHLAQDPERGAGEFLITGQCGLVRKPAAQLELEEAFAMYTERRPDDARARCAELAKRHATSDPGLYKLAVLAEAWIAELSGDLDGAIELLEGLGRQRGFELDLDRLLGLARIYERAGTPERTRAGIKVLRHLEAEFERRGIEKMSLLGRLAALYVQVGEPDRARRYQSAYVSGLRRRMHRPDLGDVVRVAARRHLPLDELARIRPRGELSREAPRVERALAAAIAGRADEARAGFAAGGTPLDAAYLAELSPGPIAVGRYLEAFDLAPEDPLILGWLLDRHAGEAIPGLVERLSDPARSARARELLRRTIALAPLRPAPWRQLAVLLALTGDLDEATRCRDRAAALEAGEASRLRPIGRVLAAGVYHFLGKAKGLIHEVWVHREPATDGAGGTLPRDHILGNLTDEMKASVRNTFTAVREYARTHFPHRTGDLARYTYTYKLPKEDEPSGGLSAGLPSALAFLSAFLQLPVPQDVASSGLLVTESHLTLSIGRVGEVEYKVRGAYNRNLRSLILPAANRVDLDRNLIAPPELVDELVTFVSSFGQAARLVFGDDVFVAS